jgi:uncharacterized protein (UPF0332 family)
MVKPTDEDARRELERAGDALHDAQVLFDGEGTDAGVINRLYYAAFHAAQAVLYDRGENPASHGRVRQQFGQHVVLQGDATREEGRLLGTLYDYRQAADYGAGSTPGDVDALIGDVEEFVTHMKSLIDTDTSTANAGDG